ncbi:hypothetical protein DMUE_2530 [Dictyocoela muelleri]|nr:hypothetical protein DMUE_2530 [Dictyocoela muelleri]
MLFLKTLFLQKIFSAKNTKIDNIEQTLEEKNQIIKIRCSDEINITLMKNVWSKYEYLENLIKNDITIIADNEIESEDLKIFKNITLGEKLKKNFINECTFFKVLNIFAKYKPKESIKNLIYSNIVNVSINKADIAEIIRLYSLDGDECFKNMDFLSLDSTLWVSFLNKILKEYKLAFDVSDSTLELLISEKINNEAIKVDFLNITSLKIDFNVFELYRNKDKVIQLLLKIGFFSNLLLGNNSKENNIQELFLRGNLSLNNFFIFLSMFKVENKSVKKLIIHDLSGSNDVGLITGPEWLLYFIRTFKSLNYLSLHLSSLLSSNDLRILLNDEKIQQNLKSLIITETTCLTDGTENLISNLPNLSSLWLTDIKNYQLYEILKDAKFKNTLEELKLRGSSKILKKCAKLIANFKRLVSLDFTLGMDSESLSNVLKQKNIQSKIKVLILKKHKNLSRQNCELISKFKVLEELDLSDQYLCGKFLSILVSSEKLQSTIKKLNLENIQNLKSHHTEKLQFFNCLECLNLSHCELNQETIKNIVKSKKLQSTIKELNLSNINLADEILKDISEFKSLERLDVSSCSLSDKALTYLFQSPNLQNTIQTFILSANQNISKTHFENIFKFKRLEVLELKFCDLKIDLFMSIIGDKKSPLSLKKIIIRRNYSIGLFIADIENELNKLGVKVYY